MSGIPAQILSSSDDIHAYPAPDMVSLLLKNAEKFRDKALYIFLDDGVNESLRISYRDVVMKAKAVAAELQKNGKKGDHILLLFPAGIEFVISLYGCFLAGMVAIPAYPPRRRKVDPRFLSIIHDASPSAILTTKQIHSDLEQLNLGEIESDNINLLIYETIREDQAQEWIDPQVKPDDMLLLQYTSGSTGTPKGIMVSHGNMIHDSECIKQSFGFDENMVVVNWLPNFHDMGLIGNLIQPAYVGGSVVSMTPIRFIQDPVNWLKCITKYKGTCSGAPNFAYDYCVDKIPSESVEQLDLSTLNVLYNGSEPIRKQTLERFTHHFKHAKFSSKQFFPCYGMAETVLIITGGDFKAEPVYFNADAKSLENNKAILADEGKESRYLTASGFPWLGMSVMIVRPETKLPCQQGEIGEIWAKGGSVAQGYWNKPEATKETFHAYIEGTDDGPWLRTGDLGFIHEGQLYVSGRLKDLIIIRGSNFSPNDIEHSVENCHEALRKNASAAFSMDIDDEEKLIIIQEIERAYMRNFDEDEIFENIRNAVFADHGIQPDIILLTRMGGIKKTSSGKTQRFAMRAVWKNKELDVLAEWEKKEEKENVASVLGFRPEFMREWMINWMAHTLELEPGKINPDKPVSAYGLDSIKAVSLERDVNKQFGVEWPIESFLRENSINDLIEEGIEMLRNETPNSKH